MIKLDMLFHASTNLNQSSPDPVRTAGWSEGWYNSANIADVKAASEFLCQARASLLPTNCSIIGRRFRVVGGGSSTDGKRFPGTQVINGDLPAMSLLVSVRADNAPNVRRFTLRGLPDARSEEGEFVPSQAFTTGLNTFGDRLADGGWKFKGRVLTNVKAKIQSISALGVIVTFDAIVVDPNDVVRLLNVTDANGVPRNGLYRVVSRVDSHNFTIGGYEGAVATGGFIREEASDYFAVESKSLVRGRVITHKVGRPFFQFRGRRSTRR